MSKNWILPLGEAWVGGENVFWTGFHVTVIARQ